MNYHNIVHDDMRNGVGLRVTLFVSGCENQCKGCHNAQTQDVHSGIEFDIAAKEEIMNALSKTYIAGLTLSGGDPLHYSNIATVCQLCEDIKKNYPTKTIWLYTGYTFESFYASSKQNTAEKVDTIRDLRNQILKYVDVLVDGKFVQELSDVNYHWAGSTNQRVIDVQKTLQQNEVVLYE